MLDDVVGELDVFLGVAPGRWGPVMQVPVGGGRWPRGAQLAGDGVQFAAPLRDAVGQLAGPVLAVLVPGPRLGRDGRAQPHECPRAARRSVTTPSAPHPPR